MVLAALSFAAPAVQAEDAPAPEARVNVELIFKMGRIENGQKVQLKSYRLIVAEGVEGSRLLAGHRAPFPGADGGPVVYQNIGFATDARVWLLDKKTIKVVANIEDSRLLKDELGAPPRVETRQLAVSAVLTDGVPLEITRVEGVADLEGYVDLEARLLR
jgi:hypothetical protein